MRDADNIREVEALGIDMMGFIFWPKSKRYISERPTYLPKSCKRVGVFVDEDIEPVLRIAEDYALDIIQLHGSESPEYIRELTSLLCKGEMASDHSGVRIIKAFNIATATDLAQTKSYEGIADYFLFDTKAQLPGGSGEQFDWSVLSVYDGITPFLLSGGIGPDDAERIRAFHHPRCIGIDLNSRFEMAPALKDIAILRHFLSHLTHLTH